MQSIFHLTIGLLQSVTYIELRGVSTLKSDGIHLKTLINENQNKGFVGSVQLILSFSSFKPGVY